MCVVYGVQCTLHVTRLQLINENKIEITDPANKASGNKNVESNASDV